VVIADDNAWYRSMRRALWALARGAGSAFLSLHLNLGPHGVEVAVARDGGRPPLQRVGGATISRMAAALEAPGGSGWEGPHAWAVDAVGADAAGVAAVVMARLTSVTAWAELPVPRASPRAGGGAEGAAAAKSLLHQADLALRRAVGRVAAGGGGGAHLAAAKAAALELARASTVTGALQAAIGGWPPGGADSDGDGEGGAAGGRGAPLLRLQEWADARIRDPV
jgi:hypothetical protein